MSDPGAASGDDPPGSGGASVDEQVSGDEEYVDVDYERVSDDDSTRES